MTKAETLTPLAKMGDSFSLPGLPYTFDRILFRELRRRDRSYFLTCALFNYAALHQPVNDMRGMVAEIPYQLHDRLEEVESKKCVNVVASLDDVPIGVIQEYGGYGGANRQHYLVPKPVALGMINYRKAHRIPGFDEIAFAVDARQFKPKDLKRMEDAHWKFAKTTAYPEYPAELVTRVVITRDDLRPRIFKPIDLTGLELSLQQVLQQQLAAENIEDLKVVIQQLPSEHLVAARNLARDQVHGSFDPYYIEGSAYPYFGVYLKNSRNKRVPPLLIAMAGYDAVYSGNTLDDIQLPPFAIATNLVVMREFRKLGIAERLRYFTHSYYFKHQPDGMIFADLTTPESMRLYTKKFNAHVIKQMWWGSLRYTK